MFEVAYAVHKRRSVKFCGIVFDVSFCVVDRVDDCRAHNRQMLPLLSHVEYRLVFSTDLTVISLVVWYQHHRA